ncbi:redoxin domain-containing protein [Thalassoglobus polymorphus]|uniref:Thiol-disulfide oxidoreductase n=1 Tax=Thalassoglobus polymorphus TaxID=2527994 RepID=A0A517QS08_9PLAN|nr:redoxin domain-containing protein [Thalassoglobus polymorphus]QDT34407.1 thiol-disulfide oxidoreductase [Thalassoglobus polymorphus]
MPEKETPEKLSRRPFSTLLAIIMAYCITTCSTALAGVGDVISEFELNDYQGKKYTLSDFDESQLVVLAFIGTDCPLAKLYAGRLEQLSQQYGKEQLTIIAVDSLIQDSISEIAAWAREHKLTYPVLKDPAQTLADAAGAQRTPQVFLLDQRRTIQYEGRVDDQYVIGIVRDQPTRTDLKIAIDELLAGKQVSVKQTQPLGCIIARAQKPNENSSVTYSNQISRIFQKNCASCHREGEVAPFSLETYEDVLGWGPMIEEVVREQRMPPWHADPKHGKFANDSSLTAQEKKLIYEWVKNGSPQGNPADLPEPVEYVSGWQLPKEPDVIFEMAEKPFKVAADAGPRGIPYQRFWVDPKFTEDKWVIASEAKPGNSAVVHHIIVYVHPNGMHTREHEFFCAYVPGLRIENYAEGIAKKIPAGSALRFEMHYTPVGTEQEDLSTVGFIFTEPEKVTHKIVTMHAGNASFELKPFKSDQVVTARSGESPGNLKLLSMSPHMHLRGQSFKYEALLPDGTREVLLNVPNYDFNWQTRYVLAEPREMPKGTRLLCTAKFDNSKDNLANPDPSATVRWGDQSWDEMMLGYYDVLLPVNPEEENDAKNVPANLLNVDLILKLVDKDGDKSVSPKEAEAHPLINKSFKKMDLNKDGAISEDELDKVFQHLKQKRKI